MGLKPLLRLLAVTSAILHVLALVPSSPTRRDVNADGLDERARHDAVVDLGYAKYLGVFSAETDVTNFLGVRFAAAPEGDLAAVLLARHVAYCLDSRGPTVASSTTTDAN